MGLTSEVKRVFVTYGSSKSLAQRFIKPKTLDALFVVRLICKLKHSLVSMMIPRSLNDETSSSKFLSIK